jgi:hypothetical protein
MVMVIVDSSLANFVGSGAGMLAGWVEAPLVVPAKAGAHNHRWILFVALLPQVASSFRIIRTEGMDPACAGTTWGEIG